MIQEFDFHVDIMRALLWQYNEATSLQSVIQQKQDWYNLHQEEFWISWFRDVFDLRTANQFGLSVWSIILDIPIIVVTQEPDPADEPFGYGPDDGNFEHSNFARDAFEVQQLTVEQARTVLLMRYNQITSDGTVPHTNEFLAWIFRDIGGAYVTDNYDMTVDYNFLVTPPARLSYIFANYDIFPRPAAVGFGQINVNPKIPFGFDEHNNNFDQGNFDE